MSIELQNIQRLRAFEESAANFGNDLTADLDDFVDVPFIEGSASATIPWELLNPETVQQHIDALPTFILGQKSWTLSFDINLAATGIAADDGTTQVQDALGLMMKVFMGGEDLSTGQAASGTPTTTNVASDAAYSGGEIYTGSAIGLVNSSGALEAREISTAGGSSAALKLALSEAPSADDDIYAAATYYLTKNPTSSLQFALEGAEQDDRWLLMGGQLDSISFSVQLGQIPRVTLNFKGVAYEHGDDTETTLTGSALGTASYENHEPITVTGGRFDFVDVGTSTLPASGLCVSSLDLTLNLSYTAIPCANGPGNVKGWKRTRSAPTVTYGFTTFFEDTSFKDDRDARTAKALFAQFNAVPGKTLLLTVPTGQITSWERVDYEGMAGQRVEVQGRLDEAVGSATTERAQSVFRIHKL